MSKIIINPEAIERLQEHFNADQLREISFALNPDCENLGDTLCKMDETIWKMETDIEDLEEEVLDLSMQLNGADKE